MHGATIKISKKDFTFFPFRALQFSYYNSYQKNKCTQFYQIYNNITTNYYLLLSPKCVVSYWAIIRECNDCTQYRPCTFDNVRVRCVRATIVAVGKQGVTTFFLRQRVFVRFGTQSEMRMRRISICDHPSFTIYISTLSHKRHDFRARWWVERGGLLITKCVF